MIYAKTLDSGELDYRTYEDELLDNEDIIIKGNRDYEGVHESIYEKIVDLSNDFYQFNDYHYYDNLTDYITTKCPEKANGKKLSKKEVSTIHKAITDNTLHETEKERNLVKTVLSIVHGEPYEYRTIRGSSQSSWDILYYPTRYTKEQVNYIEALYFGEVIGIEVHDAPTPVNDANDIVGYTIISTDFSVEGIKQAIRDNEGSNEEIKLFLFDGYTQVAKYKEA